MQEFVTLFGNGFFPVIMCGVLFWYVTRKDEQHKAEIEALRETIDANNRLFVDALGKVETAVNNLTAALNSKED